MPIGDEVGTIIVGDGNDDNSNERVIIMRAKDGQFWWIFALHPYYSPLHYVLLFPDGRDGWHIEIPLNGFILDENAAFVNDGEQAIVGKGGSTSDPNAILCIYAPSS